MSLHVEVAGDGPPLVLLHGWAMHGGVFAPLVERLAPRFTLHLVDLPGHGHSRDSGVPLRLDACVEAMWVTHHTPLFGEGLGLDSIDALELGIAIKKKFAVSLEAGDTDTRAHFRSVASLAAFIRSQSC